MIRTHGSVRGRGPFGLLLLDFMKMAVMPYTYEACGLSDTELVRENSEDVWAIIEEVNFFALTRRRERMQAGTFGSRDPSAL